MNLSAMLNRAELQKFTDDLSPLLRDAATETCNALRVQIRLPLKDGEKVNMPYAIIFDDEPGTEQLRLELREAHLEYMRANVYRVLASGGFLDDRGQVGTGGLIVLDTDSREEAEDFVKGDPFFTGGLYKNASIRRWRKAFFDGKTYI